MKKMQMKSILLLALVMVVLAAAVGGTVAYLATRTTPVVNTFTPAEVKVDVTDTVSGNTKSNVDVVNLSNIPAFIRVAITANWCDDSGKVVAPWNDYANLGVKSDWSRIGSYYYYTKEAAVGETIDLFDSYTATGGPAGAHLEMDIIAQAIQSQPTSVVQAAWGFVPGGTN